jgi:hypothetical protein
LKLSADVPREESEEQRKEKSPFVIFEKCFVRVLYQNKKEMNIG